MKKLKMPKPKVRAPKVHRVAKGAAKGARVYSQVKGEDLKGWLWKRIEKCFG